MSNFTIPNVTAFPVPEKMLTGQQIIDWCREQHFAHDYQGMWFLFAALFFWLLYFIMEWAKPYWKGEDTKINDFVLAVCHDMAFLMTLAFAIYWIFTKGA